MYCSHCGKEISDGVDFCPHCGTNLKQAPNETEQKDEFFEAPPAPPAPPAPEQTAPVRAKRVNLLAIIGFALSLFGYFFGGSSWVWCIFTVLVCVAGLVCSIFGLLQCKRNGAGSKGLAIAGIVIGAIGAVANVAMMIIFILYPNFWEDLIYNVLGPVLRRAY